MLRKHAQRRITLLIALMLLFSVLLPALALAATPNDVAGTKYANAFYRLNTLGVMVGDAGGFRPGDNITRAEFAAVAIRILGLEQAGQYAKGPTAFSDVPASHWATGYINVAQSNGIIKGYPDGTFKPEANVSYAEVATMLVRALGYEPDVKGSWPTGHIAKAVQLGLTSNTDFQANAPATRGDVAIMTDKSTVDTPPLRFDRYDSNGVAQYVVDKGNTLAKEYLSVAEGDVTIDAIDTENNSVTSWTPVDLAKPVADKEGRVVGTPVKLLNAEVADLQSMLGKKMHVGAKEVVLGDGKAWRLIYATPLTSSENVITGTINDDDLKGAGRVVNGANLGSDAVVTEFDVKLADGTIKTYKMDIAANLEVERNRRALSATNLLSHNDSVELILNDAGRVRFIKATKLDEPAIVKSFEAKGTNGRTYDTLNVYLPGETGITALDTNANFVSDVVITKDGKPAGLSDLKEGDLVQFGWSDNTDYAGRDITIVKAYAPTTVTGKLTKSSTDKDGNRLYTVDGKDYKLPNRVNGAAGTTAVVVKIDSNEGAYNSATHDTSLLGSTLTFTLSASGSVRYINAATSESSLAGYVKSISSGSKSGLFGDEYITGSELTIVTKAGETKKAIIDSATATVGQNTAAAGDDVALAKGDVVNLKLSNGYVKGQKSKVYSDLAGNTTLVRGIVLQSEESKLTDAVDNDSNASATTGEGYVASGGTLKVQDPTVAGGVRTLVKGSDTVVFDPTGSVVSGSTDWSLLKSGQVVNIALNDNGITIDYVAVMTQPAVWGYTIDKYSYADEDSNKNIVKVLTKSGAQEYEVGALPAALYLPAQVTANALVNDVVADPTGAAADKTTPVPAGLLGFAIAPNSILGSQQMFQLDTDNSGTLNAGDAYVLVTDSTFIVNAIDNDNPVAASFGNINNSSQVKVFATTGTGTQADPYQAKLIVIMK